MTREDFARAALDVLTTANPGGNYEYHADRFTIDHTDQGGTVHTTSLANFHDEYLQGDDRARRSVLDKLRSLTRLVDGNESLAEVRVSIVPRIRPRRHFEVDLRAQMAEVGRKAAKVGTPPKEPPDVEYKPFAEHFGIGVAIDRPTHIEYVMAPAKRFGISLAEAMDIGRANLRRMTEAAGGAGAFREAAPGVWIASWGDDYAVERMLEPALFDALAVKGKAVVFAPGADALVVTGADDAGGLAAAFDLAQERLSQARPLVGFAFVRKGDAWTPFEAGAEVAATDGTPLRDRLNEALVRHLMHAYAAQKEMLERADGTSTKTDAFVASVMGAANDAGQIVFAASSWGKGVEALLPRTDAIGFAGEGDGVLMVNWHDAVDVVGERLAPEPGLYPPRWRTHGFPDRNELARLRAKERKAPQRRQGEDRDGTPPLALPAAMLILRVVVLMAIAVAVAFAFLR
jgi:hypothetical protein